MPFAPLRPLWEVVYDIYLRFNAHDGWAIASHVALSVLLALFPFLIVVTALASFLGSYDYGGVRVEGYFDPQQIIGLAFEGWPRAISDPIAGELTRVLTGRRLDLVTIGVVLVLWTASSGVEAMRVALVRAYGVPDMRSWWWTRIQSVAFVLLGAVGMLLLSVVVVLWTPLWDFFRAHWPELNALVSATAFVRYTLTGLFLAGGLILAHIWLPAGRVDPLATLPGTGLTLIGWLVGAAGFGYWFASFADYASTYAGLASIMAVIFFLYINSVVFILGGELNAALCVRKAEKAKRSAEQAARETGIKPRSAEEEAKHAEEPRAFAETHLLEKKPARRKRAAKKPAAKRKS